MLQQLAALGAVFGVLVGDLLCRGLFGRGGRRRGIIKNRAEGALPHAGKQKEEADESDTDRERQSDRCVY